MLPLGEYDPKEDLIQELEMEAELDKLIQKEEENRNDY